MSGVLLRVLDARMERARRVQPVLETPTMTPEPLGLVFRPWWGYGKVVAQASSRDSPQKQQITGTTASKQVNAPGHTRPTDRELIRSHQPGRRPPSGMTGRPVRGAA